MNQPMTTEKAASRLREIAIDGLDMSEEEIDSRAAKLFDSYEVLFKSHAYHRVLAERSEEVDRIEVGEYKLFDSHRYKVGAGENYWVPIERRIGYHLNQSGADMDADGHVYVLELDHAQYDEPWFYVGMVKSDLFSRLENHVSSFRQTIEKDGMLVSNASEIVEVVDIERVVNVAYDLPEELRNVERKTSYQVAIDYDTTHVVGGM